MTVRMRKLGVLLALISGAGAAEAAPVYRIALDARDPTLATFVLEVPEPGEQRLKGEEARLVAVPACGGEPLRRVAPGRWIKPAGCREIRWSARLADHDAAGVDAPDPESAWSRRNRLWLLTAHLPWLAYEHQPDTPVLVAARLAAGRDVTRRFVVTPGRNAPYCLVVGAGAVRRYAQPGLEILVRGNAPRFAGMDRLQRAVAGTWLGWRRDILPTGAPAPSTLEIVWLQPRRGSAPGFYASAGSHAILMQYAPDPAEADPPARLRASVMLIGAHEGFHVLLGGVPGRRPAWINESWASYFAIRAARLHLDPAALAIAETLIATPEPRALLDAERRFAAGDQGAVIAFYGKGARFWAAIEAVLDVAPNSGGRLAALIRATGGFAGLDWLDADAVAATFDRHSGGRAGPIVRCYLVEPDCPG